MITSYPYVRYHAASWFGQRTATRGSWHSSCCGCYLNEVGTSLWQTWLAYLPRMCWWHAALACYIADLSIIIIAVLSSAIIVQGTNCCFFQGAFQRDLLNKYHLSTTYCSFLQPYPGIIFAETTRWNAQICLGQQCFILKDNIIDTRSNLCLRTLFDLGGRRQGFQQGDVPQTTVECARAEHVLHVIFQDLWWRGWIVWLRSYWCCDQGKLAAVLAPALCIWGEHAWGVQ